MRMSEIMDPDFLDPRMGTAPFHLMLENEFCVCAEDAFIISDGVESGKL